MRCRSVDDALLMRGRSLADPWLVPGIMRANHEIAESLRGPFRGRCVNAAWSVRVPSRVTRGTGVESPWTGRGTWLETA